MCNNTNSCVNNPAKGNITSQGLPGPKGAIGPQGSVGSTGTAGTQWKCGALQLEGIAEPTCDIVNKVPDEPICSLNFDPATNTLLYYNTGGEAADDAWEVFNEVTHTGVLLPVPAGIPEGEFTYMAVNKCIEAGSPDLVLIQSNPADEIDIWCLDRDNCQSFRLCEQCNDGDFFIDAITGILYILEKDGESCIWRQSVCRLCAPVT